MIIIIVIIIIIWNLSGAEYWLTRFKARSLAVTRRHSLTTQTMKMGTQTFRMTLWVMMMHHHTKCGCIRRFSGSEDIFQTKVWQTDRCTLSLIYYVMGGGGIITVVDKPGERTDLRICEKRCFKVWFKNVVRMAVFRDRGREFVPGKREPKTEKERDSRKQQHPTLSSGRLTKAGRAVE